MLPFAGTVSPEAGAVAVHDRARERVADSHPGDVLAVRVRHRDRPGDDSVPRDGAGLRDVDLPVGRPRLTRLHLEVRRVDGLLDVPRVDLLPRRVGGLRDVESLDARIALRIEAEVDVADAVRPRPDLTVRVDRRRDPRVGVVEAAVTGVVVVDHRVRAALHHDRGDVVRIGRGWQQRPAERSTVLVEPGDLDERVARRVLAAFGQRARVDPERDTARRSPGRDPGCPRTSSWLLAVPL